MLLIGNTTCAYAVDLNVLAEWWMSADEVTVSRMSVGTPPAAGTSRSWVSWLALLLGAVAVVLSALALFGSPAPYAPSARSAETTPLAPPTEQKTAGGADACSVAVTATEAIARDRRPFLEAPPQWDDPITVAALTRAQASALVELEAMRAAVGLLRRPSSLRPSRRIAAESWTRLTLIPGGCPPPFPTQHLTARRRRHERSPPFAKENEHAAY